MSARWDKARSALSGSLVLATSSYDKRRTVLELLHVQPPLVLSLSGLWTTTTAAGVANALLTSKPLVLC